eukprot:TRINITY_DN3266_c1_g1_i1.p1 TRINITY_DN3266_c1_g1~~TRINITY_DN3266_c1_g1_i1.p1  ORF type:complete len:321 (-),score=85.48 TRINITY_DN3266_c1_g1_i1:222-1184(-)
MSSDVLGNKSIDENFLLEIDNKNESVLSVPLEGLVYFCNYSPNGKYFAIVQQEATPKVIILDGNTEKHIISMDDHNDEVNAIAFSANNKYFATCSCDKTIIIYNLDDFSIYATLVNNSFVYTISFSICSDYIYSGDEKGYIKLWNIKDRNVVKQTNISREPVIQITLSDDGKQIIGIPVDNFVTQLDSENLCVNQVFKCEEDILTACLHPTENVIAVADANNLVDFCSTENGTHINSLQYDDCDCIIALEYLSPNILIVMSEHFIQLINAETFTKIQRIEFDESFYQFSYAISPDKKKVMCAIVNDLSRIKKYSLEDYSN